MNEEQLKQSLKEVALENINGELDEAKGLLAQADKSKVTYGIREKIWCWSIYQMILIDSKYKQ